MTEYLARYKINYVSKIVDFDGSKKDRIIEAHRAFCLTGKNKKDLERYAKNEAIKLVRFAFPESAKIRLESLIERNA